MNKLLLWMSARQTGSLASFRNFLTESQSAGLAARRRSAPYRITAWNISKLGHAEFGTAAGGQGWRIAPPVLAAGAPEGFQQAVYCGARTDATLAALSRAAVGSLQLVQQPQAPDAVLLRAETPAALAAVAAECGIPLQWNAPLAVLAACQPVSMVSFEECPMPLGAGWTISRFSKSRLEWSDCSAAEARSAKTNLLRFRAEHAATAYVLHSGGRFWACDPAVGKYRVLTRRHRVLAYTAASEELRIAATCRPPELIERALVVSSGRLPQLHLGPPHDQLVYSSISLATASSAAAMLGQRIH
jgi:hypothetical protein